MKKTFAVGITLIITSFFYFPIMFMMLPSAINTKLIMAVVGVVILGIQSAEGRTGSLDKNLLKLSAFAVIFSLVCFFSVVFSGMRDYAYATYIVSMWVWLSGAYAVCQCIRKVHGAVSFRTLAHYLVAVCVAQCFFALAIDQFPAFKSLVDAYIFQDQDFLTKVKRLYGIGVMLDTAGVRFSIVLLLLSYLVATRKEEKKQAYLLLYLSAFIILAVIGNMMARTTLVGVVLSLLFLGYKQLFRRERTPFTHKELWTCFLMIMVVFIPIIVYLYHTNIAIRQDLRFGFEGFFNLVEKGHWEVGSNKTLKSMIVFPESLKTWLIGDGYFSNPIATDPYFTGKIIEGYYMGTDIGYLRFIFYCGVAGLIAFSLFICKAVILCIGRFPEKKVLLLFLLFLNFIVWLKVSTDIFLIFALLLMVDSEVDAKREKTNSAVV